MRQMEVGMDKLLEKKNLGIPATLLAVFAYLIGYYIAESFGGFFVALVFAAVVFALDFDDKVKTAIKQAYILGLIFRLIYLVLEIVDQLASLSSRIHILYRIFNGLYSYASILFSILVIVVFALLALTALFNKELKINFILGFIGEGTPKAKPAAQPVYQQPAAQQPQQMYQQSAPQQPYQQPATPTPQPVPPTPQPAPVTCPKCGTVNHQGAAFCASCGNKLN